MLSRTRNADDDTVRANEPVDVALDRKSFDSHGAGDQIDDTQRSAAVARNLIDYDHARRNHRTKGVGQSAHVYVLAGAERDKSRPSLRA